MTREEQLLAKSSSRKKKGQPNEADQPSKTGAAGRGGGRGRGRGSGRGQSRGNRSSSTTKTDEQGHSADKARKQKQKEQQNSKAEDWTVWGAFGTDAGWQETWWGGDETWAWDSAAYWDMKVSTQRLPDSHPESASSTAQPASGSSKAGKAKETKARTRDASQRKAEEEQDSNRRKKPKTGAQNETKLDGGSSTKRKRKATDTTEQDSKPLPKQAAAETTKGKGRKKAAAAGTAKAEQAPAAKGKRTSKACKAVTDNKPAPTDAQAQRAEIREYMKKFRGLKKVDAKAEMCASVGKYTGCRLNKYWKRSAAGVTSKREGKDFAYFRCKLHPEDPWEICMGASLKGAEILVAWWRFRLVVLLDVFCMRACVCMCVKSTSVSGMCIANKHDCNCLSLQQFVCFRGTLCG